MGSLLVWLGFVVASFSAGAIGGWATGPAISGWYAGLAKPSWNPPGWVFGPVWTALYLLMGTAAWVAWRSGAPASAWWAFGLQLLLNALWSVLFFGLKRPDLALVEIVLLALAIGWCALSFASASKLAGWMMAPYLAWVLFATVLNATIWLLNR